MFWTVRDKKSQISSNYEEDHRPSELAEGCLFVSDWKEVVVLKLQFVFILSTVT
jgi:hypothetical protein